MRILIAVHTYYPDKNGVQMVTQYIAEGLAKKHKILVVTELKDMYPSEDYCGNVQIERIKVKRKGYKFTGDKKKFLYLINNFNADVLVSVCTQSWPFDWLWNELNKLKCKKVLYTHGYSGLLKHYPVLYDFTHLKMRALNYHLHWMFYYRKAYKYIEKYDLVTYLSKENISFWYAQKYNLNNGKVLCNAVEELFFYNSSIERVEKGLTDGVIRFIYVANYDSNKNQKQVLKAFYLTHLKNVEIIFIGSYVNEYYDELLAADKFYKECGMNGKTFFMTGLSRNDIASHLEKADIFICGSKKEEYPIMLCEAAAKGLPIISTDVGHASQMMGSLIVHSYEEMSMAMKTLYNSKEERIKRGNELRKFALENYQIKDKIECFEKMILSL